MLPKAFTAGSTLEITTAGGAHPAPEWPLTYQLRGPGQITISCGNVGSDHYIKVPATITAEYIPGNYWYIGYAVNDSGDRIEIESGTITIKQNLAAVSTAYDGRTHIKRVLDAIEARIEGRMTDDVESYQIAGVSISKIPMNELIRYRQQYISWYQEELAAERIAKGLGTGRIIKTRL